MKRTCSSSIAGLLFLNMLLWANSAHSQLTANPAILSFGSVQTGTSSSQSLELGNSSKSDLTISQVSLSGQGFSVRGLTLPLTLPAGKNVTVYVVFAPVSGGGASGSLSLISLTTAIHDRSGKHDSVSAASAMVSLNGTGSSPSPTLATPGVLVANPTSLSFAGIQTGSSQTLWETLTNSGASAVTISQATIAQGTTTGNSFTLNGLNLATTLAAGQSVTFSVTFTPLSAGSVNGSVSISSDASTPKVTIPMAGTGMAQGQLAVAPVSSDFGIVTVGTSKAQSGTLVASGSSVTLSSASVTDSEFSLSGIAFPLTIAAGQRIPFMLTFAPRTSGTAAASLSFASTATNLAAESLSGTGVAPPQHSVNLFWGTSPAAVGYNVYRGNQLGGPYSKINPVLDASTTYTDNSVQGGQSYYYVTTAVDSTGTESTYSNETHAVIPSP